MGDDVDIKEIRERRKELQEHIADRIAAFEKETSLEVKEIKLLKCLLGSHQIGGPTRISYSVVLDTPI